MQQYLTPEQKWKQRDSSERLAAAMFNYQRLLLHINSFDPTLCSDGSQASYEKLQKEIELAKIELIESYQIITGKILYSVGNDWYVGGVPVG